MHETIYTIGHSIHPIEVFVGVLQRHAVTAVSDVRSSPYSRFNPQFNRETLKAHLAAAGIGYVFLGKELGARSDDPTCYENGKVCYDRLAETSPFKSGLARLIIGASEHRIALLCAEKEPLRCHRTILVARALEKRGVSVRHILADGEIETHDAAIGRLVAMLKLDGGDLFLTDNDRRERAYAIQAEAIAYKAAGSRRRSLERVESQER